MKNKGPNETQYQFKLAVYYVCGIDIDKSDTLTFQELQGNADIFQLLRPMKYQKS